MIWRGHEFPDVWAKFSAQGREYDSIVWRHSEGTFTVWPNGNQDGSYWVHGRVSTTLEDHDAVVEKLEDIHAACVHCLMTGNYGAYGRKGGWG